MLLKMGVAKHGWISIWLESCETFLVLGNCKITN